MRVAVIYNEPVDDQDPSEYGVVDQARMIAAFLAEDGHEVTNVGMQDALELMRRLSELRPDAAFNCCETYRGQPLAEPHVASMFELLGIAYTGTPALGLGLSVDKSMAKALFLAHGVPTPAFAVVSSADDPAVAEHLHFPLIVKPVANDASNGIDAGAVVHDRRALEQRVAWIERRFDQRALVEEFIQGREISAALLAENSTEFTALPLSEIVFDGMPEGHPEIVSFDAKWNPESRAWKATVPRCPAAVSAELENRIRAIARDAARAVGLRDYGRVDLRIRKHDDAVFVLEVNPNPDISQDSGFARAVQASGRTLKEAVCAIMNRALERSR